MLSRLVRPYVRSLGSKTRLSDNSDDSGHATDEGLHSEQPTPEEGSIGDRAPGHDAAAPAPGPDDHRPDGKPTRQEEFPPARAASPASDPSRLHRRLWTRRSQQEPGKGPVRDRPDEPDQPDRSDQPDQPDRSGQPVRGPAPDLSQPATRVQDGNPAWDGISEQDGNPGRDGISEQGPIPGRHARDRQQELDADRESVHDQDAGSDRASAPDPTIGQDDDIRPDAEPRQLIVSATVLAAGADPGPDEKGDQGLSVFESTAAPFRPDMGSGRPSQPEALGGPGMSKQEELARVIYDMRRSIPELHGVMIASTDGLSIAHDFPEAEAEKVAAMAATALGLGKRITERTNLGGLHEAVVRGDYGYLVVYSAGEKAVLVMSGPITSNLGLMRIEARSASAVVSQVLR